MADNTVTLDAVQAVYSKHFAKIKDAHEEIVRQSRAFAGPNRAAFNLGTLTGEFCKDAPIFTQAVKSLEQWAWLIPVVNAYVAYVNLMLEVVDAVAAKVCPART
jgi:hypothetical protein